MSPLCKFSIMRSLSFCSPHNHFWVQLPGDTGTIENSWEIAFLKRRRHEMYGFCIPYRIPRCFLLLEMRFFIFLVSLHSLHGSRECFNLLSGFEFLWFSVHLFLLVNINPFVWLFWSGLICKSVLLDTPKLLSKDIRQYRRHILSELWRDFQEWVRSLGVHC